jgi:hypothetical protein
MFGTPHKMILSLDHNARAMKANNSFFYFYYYFFGPQTGL